MPVAVTHVRHRAAPIRTSLTRVNGTSTSYGDDAASRLTSQTIDLVDTAGDQTITLAYNPAGQIVSWTGSNNAYAYTGRANQDLIGISNGRNQLTAQGATGVSYDGRGSVAAIYSSLRGHTASAAAARKIRRI